MSCAELKQTGSSSGTERRYSPGTQAAVEPLSQQRNAPDRSGAAGSGTGVGGESPGRAGGLLFTGNLATGWG